MLGEKPEANKEVVVEQMTRHWRQGFAIRLEGSRRGKGMMLVPSKLVNLGLAPRRCWGEKNGFENEKGEGGEGGERAADGWIPS